MLSFITRPYHMIMGNFYSFKQLLTSYPTIVTASLFLVYLLLLLVAYLLGKKHGISYKRYSKDIIKHNSRLKSIAKTCRILNILSRRTTSFTKIVGFLGILGYFTDLGQVWSKNYGVGNMAGFKIEMLLESFHTTKFALICVLVSILLSSILSYFLRKRLQKERNKIL